MRIEEALDLFVVQLRADGRSSHTVEQYRRHVLLLARWMGDESKAGGGRARRARGRSLGRVEGIGHQDLARFLVSPAARQRPDGTEKRATSTNALRTSLRCFFAYLSDAGIIEQNPARLIRRARCASPPPRALSRGEQEKLLAAMAAASGPGAERDHMLFALMLATGLRLGSAVAVERRDVDLERGELRVRRTKGDRPDVVYLGRGIRRQLRKYLGKRGLADRDPLFQGVPGVPIGARSARRRFGLWCRAAGIEGSYSPHSLRHSFATELLRNTSNLSLLQAALHHRSIGSTCVYARADQEQVKRAVRDL